MKIQISHQILYGRNNYFITRDGKVKNIDTDKYLKTSLGGKGYKTGKGYYQLGLSHNGKDKKVKIHRLLAEAYIPNPNNKPQVDHINRDTMDNRLENLRWASIDEQRENQGIRSDSLLGVKYIRKNEWGAYRVRMRKIKKDKTFSTLEEAINYRNIYYNE